MTDPRVFRRLWPEFSSPSWAPWNSIEDALHGLVPEDGELVRRVTGRDVLPRHAVEEFWAVVGRGGGKSRFCGRLACYFATAVEYRRAPGESIYVGVFAPTRAQAQITFRYIRGLLRSVPELERLIVSEQRDSLELEGGVVVEVITASVAAPRGRSYALAILEEAAFLPSEDASDPDKELLNAIRPALARVPGSLLAVVSSPYARRGELYRVHRDHFGKASDSILVVQADTLTLNPSFSKAEIERAYAEDDSSASAEYGAQFRRDVESFIDVEAVEACRVPGRRELPRVDGVGYHGFTDPAGGSGTDSWTIAVGHRERDGRVILDAIRERKPPFSPDAVASEFADLLKIYGVTTVRGDRFGGEFPREALSKRGIRYIVADKAKSDYYKDALSVLNSGRLELLDDDRLITQITRLERRTARGGRDSIDHGPSGHDDLANSALALAAILGTRRVREPGDPLVYFGPSRRDDPALAVLAEHDAARQSAPSSPWFGEETCGGTRIEAHALLGCSRCAYRVEQAKAKAVTA